jgi:peptide/nickel transport system permease protein
MSGEWARRLIGRRLLAAVPVLLLVVCGTFALMEAAPGDAVDAYLLSMGGGDAALAAQLRETWGTEGSFARRLLVYLASLARGDLGHSFLFDRPIAGLVLERLPNTLLLMGGALLLAASLGTTLGIVAGARPGDWPDRALSALSLVLYAMPGFWLGLVLAVIFAVRLRWLPLSGIETLASDLTGLARALDIARHLVLPTLSLGLIYMALYLRVMRAGMAAVWRRAHVRAAMARGIARRRIVLRHVARNALLPLVTMIGLQAAGILGGSVVIESVFAIPGMGRLAYEAVQGRDTPLLMGVILASAVMVILVNLAVDLLYAALDPRVGAGA